MLERKVHKEVTDEIGRVGWVQSCRAWCPGKDLE